MDLIQQKNVEILLDSDESNYQSGQTISGTIIIALNGELELSRVNIVLRSMAEVKWVEAIGRNYKQGYVFRDHEEYLNVVYEIPENIRKTKITKGEDCVPFEFKLPDNIPSSFETNHGFIKYWIEANINDDSFEQEVYRDKKYFIVESPFRSGLHLSVGGGTEKDVANLFLCGKVCIDASIRKKGHIPGETVEVHCLVTNTSTISVKPRAQFVQLQIFMAKEYHKTIECLSDAVVGEVVNAGETCAQTISVQIPKDISLSLKTRLISIKYFIHVALDIPYSLEIRHSNDLHLNLPIIITNEFAFDERIASFL